MNTFTASPLWGQLLSDPEIATAFSADAFIGHMIRFEAAWTDALRATGSISEPSASAALSLIAAWTPDLDALSRGSERDGLPVPALVKSLRAAADTRATQAAIHTGSTSQDVIDTSLMLTLLEVIDLFAARLTRLQDALAGLSSHFGAHRMMGRTRMQAALPISVGQRVAAWQALVDHARAQVDPLRDEIAVLQFGGAVGDRAFGPADPDLVAAALSRTLGLRAVPVWHSDRTRIVRFGHWLTEISGACGKIGKDISLMAQQGVDEVRLAAAGGSSAMPHKQNPIRAEVLGALARFVAAQQGALAQVLVHEQERSGEMWTLEWLILPGMCDAAGTSLTTALGLLAQVARLGPERSHE